MYITRENPQGGNPVTAMRYFHHDYLDSVVAISDALSVALERLSFLQQPGNLQDYNRIDRSPKAFPTSGSGSGIRTPGRSYLI